jgi:hypothetical protein
MVLDIDYYFRHYRAFRGYARAEQGEAEPGRSGEKKSYEKRGGLKKAFPLLR